MFWVLYMEFISLVRQDFLIFSLVLRTSQKSCLRCEINSIFIFKPLNILYFPLKKLRKKKIC